jgi:hypothetical protein
MCHESHVVPTYKIASSSVIRPVGSRATRLRSSRAKAEAEVRRAEPRARSPTLRRALRSLPTSDATSRTLAEAVYPLALKTSEASLLFLIFECSSRCSIALKLNGGARRGALSVRGRVGRGLAGGAGGWRRGARSPEVRRGSSALVIALPLLSGSSARVMIASRSRRRS